MRKKYEFGSVQVAQAVAGAFETESGRMGVKVEATTVIFDNVNVLMADALDLTMDYVHMISIPDLSKSYRLGFFQGMIGGYFMGSYRLILRMERAGITLKISIAGEDQ